MTVSLFLLAVSRGWNRQPVTANCLSKFATSALFDSNVLQIIFSFARPLKLVKVRTATEDENPWYMDQDVTLAEDRGVAVVVRDFKTGYLLYQWQTESRNGIRHLYFHAPKAQVIVMFFYFGSTRVMDFYTLDGTLLRRVNLHDASDLFDVTVDPQSHYIAVYGHRKLRVYDYDNLTRAKYALSLSGDWIQNVFWNSFNHQLIVALQDRITVISTATWHRTDEYAIPVPLSPLWPDFSASHQCFIARQPKGFQFWSKHGLLETLTWPEYPGTLKRSNGPCVMIRNNSEKCIYQMV